MFLLRSLHALLRTTDSRKESRCLSCYPIQLSKNRRPSKGPTSCQTLPSVSSGNVPFASRRPNCFRLLRTLRLTLVLWLERSETAGLQGQRILGPTRRTVNFAPGTVTTLCPRRLFPTSAPVCRLPGAPYRQNHSQPSAPPPYSWPNLHKLLCSQALDAISKSRFAASDPAQPHATTPYSAVPAPPNLLCSQALWPDLTRTASRCQDARQRGHRAPPPHFSDALHPAIATIARTASSAASSVLGIFNSFQPRRPIAASR